MNVFQTAPNDQSIYYLGQIFGYVGTLLPTSNTTVLSAMFKVFNTAMLVMGVLMVIYISIIGVMATAHEGEFLGKKWHKLWTPIRMVLGIATLVPTASGYSVIQLIVMWVIVQGVGAADQVWGSALKYISATGTVSGTLISSPDVQSQMAPLFQALTCQATAHGSYNYSGSPGYYCADPSINDPFCQLSSDQMLSLNGSQVSQVVTPSGQYSLYSMGPSGTGNSCGSITFCNADVACKADPTSALCTACTAQKNALGLVVSALGAVAQSFADADYSYRQFYATSTPTNVTKIEWLLNYCSAKGASQKQCCAEPPLVVNSAFPGITTPSGCSTSLFPSPDAAQGKDGGNTNANPDAINQIFWPYLFSNLAAGSNFIQSATTVYIGNITAAVVAHQTENQQLSGMYQGAYNIGWLFAGAYYFNLSQQSSAQIKASVPKFSVAGCDPNPNGPGAGGSCTSSILNGSSGHPAYRNNYDAAGNLLTTMQQSGLPQSNPTFSQVQGLTTSGLGDVLNSFQNLLTTGTLNNGASTMSILLNLHNFGIGLLTTAAVIWVIMVTLALVLPLVGGWSPFILGNGVQSPVSSALISMFMFLGPPIFALIMVLFVFGCTLAYYLPIIPYLVYTFAVVGWFMAAIETMVASPLISLAIMAPGGEHEVFGKAVNSIFLLFNVFLRPILLVFGLIAAILLMGVVISMINAGFSQVMNSVGGQGISAITDPIELIVFIFMYIALVTLTVNKCCSIIPEMPDKVMKWLGAQGMGYGADKLTSIAGAAETGAKVAKGGAERSFAAAKGAVAAQKKGGEEGGGPSVSSGESGAGGGSAGGGGESQAIAKPLAPGQKPTPIPSGGAEGPALPKRPSSGPGSLPKK